MKDYLANNISISNFSTNVSNSSSELLTNSSLILKNSVVNITQNATNLISQTEPIKIDPNWFYSSSAQCAAAIVGLMGAFLTTKLINQKSLIDQLHNEISDYKRRIDLITQQIKPKMEYVSNIDFENDCNTVREFLNFIKLTIDPNNPPSLETVYKKSILVEELKNISKEAFEQEYNDNYLEEVREAAEELVDSYLKDSLRSIDLKNPTDPKLLYDKAIKDDEYKLMNRSIFEERYNIFLEVKKKEAKRQKNPFFGLALTQPINYESLMTPPLPKMMSREDIENDRIKLENYSRYKEEISIKKVELEFYKDIVASKENMLINSDIMSLKNNLLLLFVFSLLGLFLPLFMLLLDYETMIKYRGVTFFLIFAGWLLIVFNLKTEIWKLFDKN
ncbi:hypothetical protein MSMAS_1186 [Methanosarcina mazei S-6]|uniref:Uncharacterized protein n=1 Tax=Methanosarcina mazei S-6 TaxID=213585 RepID=A0A0E3RIP3_METMZ|nr:hypothetical protein MSMAS_1186 [Methanosarcina mazei S-6]